jgi:hypothetical protein
VSTRIVCDPFAAHVRSDGRGISVVDEFPPHRRTYLQQADCTRSLLLPTGYSDDLVRLAAVLNAPHLPNSASPLRRQGRPSFGFCSLCRELLRRRICR